jgi:hypothetical protein
MAKSSQSPYLLGTLQSSSVPFVAMSELSVMRRLTELFTLASSALREFVNSTSF